MPERTDAGELNHVDLRFQSDVQDHTQAASFLQIIDLFGIGKKVAMESENAKRLKDFTRFFIASLFGCNLLLGMEPQPHTFHPSEHPKEK